MRALMSQFRKLSRKKKAKEKKGKKADVHEKPTMKVAARKRSSILPTTDATGRNRHSL